MYYTCVKKGVGEYILKNEDERKRLAVSITPDESAKIRCIEFEFGDCMESGLNIPPRLPLTISLTESAGMIFTSAFPSGHRKHGRTDVF